MFNDPSIKGITLFLFSAIFLYGLYVQFHGDYSPGGGFQAGMICASAIVLCDMIYSSKFKKFYLFFEIIAILGVITYSGTGLLTMILGSNFLSYNILANLPINGQVLGIFLVELGVAMTVSCSMILIYLSFSSYKQ